MGKPRKNRSRDKRPAPLASPAPSGASIGKSSAGRQRWTIPIGIVIVAAGLVLVFRRESPDSLYRSARSLLPRNRAKAVETLELSISRGGGDVPAAQVLRCRLYGATGRWVEAAGYFSTIPHPERAPIDELLALEAEARGAGQMLLSRLALQKGAELAREGQAAALEQLAQLELSTDHPEGARDAALQLRKLAPENPVASLVLGRLSQEARVPGLAADEFRQALARCSDPGLCDEARRGLISVLLSMGDAAEARTVWAAAPGGASPSADDLVLEATLFRLEGEPTEAARVIESLPAASREREDVLFLEGLCRLDLGRNEEAARLLTSVVDRNTYHKEAHHKLGLALQRLGERDRARRHYDRSRELTTMSLRILELEERLVQSPDARDLAAELAGLYEATGQASRANRLRQQLSRG